MWVRKRIDIGWGGIGYGLLRCLFPGNVKKHERRIASLESQFAAVRAKMADHLKDL